MKRKSNPLSGVIQDSLKRSLAGTGDGGFKGIGYYEVDKKSGKFYRVYAELVELTPHRLIIRIKNKRYVLRSPYNLLRLLIGGNLLLAFAYSPEKGKPKQLYPLPRGRTYFRPEDIDVLYSYSSPSERRKLIESSPDVAAKREHVKALEEQIKAELGFIKDHAGEALAFIRELGGTEATMSLQKEHTEISGKSVHIVHPRKSKSEKSRRKKVNPKIEKPFFR